MSRRKPIPANKVLAS
ncbi:hypothetical protein D027_2100A, partial [Vibrio parahaemolyticus 861]